MKPHRHQWVPYKKFSQFGPAVWAAIANRFTNKYTNIDEQRA